MSNNATIGTVTAKVTADTAQFDGQMAKSADIATATGRAIEKAAERQAAARAFAEKFAGDAVDGQTLRIVQARKLEAAASADVRKASQLARADYLSEGESANLVAAALQRLTAAKLATAAASEVEERTTVSNTNAASASIRLVEGGMTNNIRAVERFLGSLPGVGEALKSIFPIVGGLAFAGLIGELTMKVYEYGMQGSKAGKEMSEAFIELTDSSRQTGIELDIVNDKLDIQLAKLEKKPSNLLQLALDEDLKAVLDLASGTDKASAKIDELFKKNGVGLAQRITGMVFGKNVATTGDTQKVIDDAYAGIDTAERKGRVNLAKASPEDAKSVEQANQKMILEASQAALKSVQDRINDLQALQRDEAAHPHINARTGMADRTPTDYSANLAPLEGTATLLQGNIHDLQDRFTAADKQSQVGSDEEKAAAAARAKTAATEARQAAAEAARQQMEGFNQQLANMRQNHQLQVGEEEMFWRSMRSQTEVGGLAWNEINKKIGTAHQETMRQFATRSEEMASQKQQVDTVIGRTAEMRTRDASKQGSEQDQDYTDSNQLAITVARNQARIEEARVSEEAGRSITQYAAALHLAAIHAQEFANEEFALQAILDNAQRRAALDPTRENKRAATDAQRNLDNARSQRTVQAQGDADSIYGKSSSGAIGATDALNEFVMATRDAATMMRDIVNSTLGQVNRGIVGEVTGQGGGFKRVGTNIAGTFTNAALEKGEGSLLGLLGFGSTKKPTGAAGDPLHVVMAGGAAGVPGVVSSAASGAVSKVASSGVSGFLGGLLKSFLPGFADGGPISPDTWAMVGEQGPELFHSGGGGTIVPNHKLGDVASSSGPSQSVSYSIDARGTDPVQAEMRVKAAIVAAHGSAIRQATKQVREDSLRRPMRR
jgi:hypothetical protein